MICWKSNIFDKWRKYFDIFFIMRSSMSLICSCFKIFFIMIAIFNDSEFVCNVLSATSIWLIVIEKHYIFCFRFLTSINKQKKIASIIVIFIESSEFNSKTKTNSDCCFLIFHLLFRCFFKCRFRQEIVFVTVVMSISKLFCSIAEYSSSQSTFESMKKSKSDESNSFVTYDVENFVVKRDRIVYREFIVAICSTLSTFDNMTSRRQLNTFDWRSNLKTFKRLIWIVLLNMLSWWLHLNDLKINLSYVIFNMTSCLFIHDFSKIIEWLFKSMINKETINSKCKSIVSLKYMTWIIDETWRSSNSIRDFDFNKDTNFMFNMLHTSCAISLSMNA